MKKIFLLTICTLCIGSLFAQVNEITVHTSFFDNGNIVSGTGISYYRNVSPTSAFGIRTSRIFDQNETYQNERAWQLDLVNRIQTSSRKGMRSFIEFGGVFMQGKERQGHYRDDPILSIVDIREFRVNYLGFTLGATLDQSIGKHFRIGINYRANLLLATQEDVENKTRLISNPNCILSYTF